MGLILLIVLLTDITICYVDLIPTFGILACEVMDTFTGSWIFDDDWVCPHPHLVPRALKHTRFCCAQGSLIVLLWRSASFWPLLTSDGLHLAYFVKEWVEPPSFEDDFLHGST